MTLPELLAELATHDVEVRFVPCDGRDYAALFIDGARVSDWAKAPSGN
jgi:hypothetical protein